MNMKWPQKMVALLALLFGSIAMGEEVKPTNILIEAENFSRKKPDDKTFAIPHLYPNASNGKALIRFFKKEGRCEYDFNITRKGIYVGRLRYASEGKNWIKLGLDVTGAGDFSTQLLPGTGALEGSKAWKWTTLFKKELSAGKHTLTLGGVPIRPDCIYISSIGHEPAFLSKHGKPRMPLSEATRARLAAPLEKIRPTWLDSATEYKLPDWFEQARVCAHTRLSPPHMKKRVFKTAAKGFKSLGFKVFVRHIKSGGEGAWWPSKVGGIFPGAKERNFAKEIIDEAHKQDCRFIVYHRHMEDAFMARKHPDWVCVDWDGKPLKSPRGVYMCFNSPYADAFLIRALELADMGVDGFYFDEVHMPKTGCWCTFCRKLFKTQTGLNHPRFADHDDPIWHKLIDFNNVTLERTFLKWRKVIHGRNPEIVMLVGSNTYPGMVERHMTHRLFRIADSVKTEYSFAARRDPNMIFERDRSLKPPAMDARLALGFVLSRDSADGRPAHVWCHGLLNEASALCATAGMLTHGCIANLDHQEHEIPNPKTFKKAVALGNKVSRHFAGKRPLRWAAIHYSEHARDRYFPDETAMWKNVLYPTYGAFHALLRKRLPVGVVTDSQLEEGKLDGYQILFIPSPSLLTARMKTAVSAFKKRGGTVVEQQDGWLWHDPKGGQEKTMAAFLQSISTQATRAPVQVFGGPKKMHAVAFGTPETKEITISICNDFSWVWTGTIRPKLDAKKLAKLRKVPPPPPCKAVRITLRLPRKPVKVLEVVSGKDLAFQELKGVIEFKVPEFSAMAVVVVKYP